MASTQPSTPKWLAASSITIGSLAGQLAERDPRARAAIADGLSRWEARLREGLGRMHACGKLGV